MKTSEADGKTLVKYCLESKKFYQIYDYYKHIDKEEAASRLLYLVHCVEPEVTQEFYREMELCLAAALESESTNSPSQTFYQYLINLIELYHSNESFSNRSDELTDTFLEYDMQSLLVSDYMFNEYERSLFYEYFVMGFDGAELGERKFSNTPNIHKKLKEVLEKLELSY